LLAAPGPSPAKAAREPGKDLLHTIQKENGKGSDRLRWRNANKSQYAYRRHS
jgi:hypothetical protein